MFAHIMQGGGRGGVPAICVVLPLLQACALPERLAVPHLPCSFGRNTIIVHNQVKTVSAVFPC